MARTAARHRSIPRSLRRALVAGFAACILVALCCALTVPVPADAAWSPATTVASSKRFYFYEPALAANAAGDAVLVWRRLEPLEESNQGVEASTRGQDGTWTRAAFLGHEEGGHFVAGVDPQGNATTAWECGCYDSMGIRSAFSPAAGGWRHNAFRPVRVEDPRLSRLAVSPTGAEELVYTTFNEVRLITRTAGGKWSVPRTVYHSPRENVSEPRLAVDGRGETILAWVSYGNGNHSPQRTHALLLSPSGRPEGPVQTLTPKNVSSAELSLAADLNGDAVLLWRLKGRTIRPIQVATRSFGGRFSRAVTISRVEAAEPTAAVEPDGEMTILFTHILSTLPRENLGFTPDQRTAVEVTTSHRGGGWTKPTPISHPAGQSTCEPRLAAAPDENELFAAWTTAPLRGHREEAETLASPGAIDVSLRTADGIWQPPATLSPSDSGLPMLAFGAHGEATAAWVAQTEEPAPPFLSGVVTTTIESTQFTP
jgi:hypothetical protein